VGLNVALDRVELVVGVEDRDLIRLRPLALENLGDRARQPRDVRRLRAS
jgi:hypothetical protein